MLYDVIILGAGAAGLMSAVQLQSAGVKNIAIVEGSSKPAGKLKISGGGKCNVTNKSVEASNFLGDELFVKDVLDRFGNKELLSFLKDNSLELAIRKGRYYFCKDSSNEIISILMRLAKESDFLYSHNIQSVTKDDFFEVKTDRARLYGKEVIVATGGSSYKSLGASDVGLLIAKSFGHKVAQFEPALVGLTLQPDEFWMKELSGISMPATISVGKKSLSEELLFAHRGISGPAVLSASLYWRRGSISINFLPKESILKLCKAERKHISSTTRLPKRFIRAFLQRIGVEDKPCSSLSSREKELLETLHNYSFAPAGNFGFTKAEVSRGGVLSEELESSSMQSSLVEGLYFVGEVVDVTGELGGYNIQWAFSSAKVAAEGIASRVAQ